MRGRVGCEQELNQLRTGYVAGGAYLLVILMCLTLPETRGRNLADIT